MRYARNSKRTATFKDTAPALHRGRAGRIERVMVANGCDTHDKTSSAVLALAVDEREQKRRDEIADRYALMASSERQTYLAFRRRQVAFKREQRKAA